MYIIHERLTAQNADADRVALVLRQIGRAFFAREFCEALFAAQEVGSVNQVYGLLESLVHSSIMRLSSSR